MLETRISEGSTEGCDAVRDAPNHGGDLDTQGSFTAASAVGSNGSRSHHAGGGAGQSRLHKANYNGDQHAGNNDGAGDGDGHDPYYYHEEAHNDSDVDHGGPGILEASSGGDYYDADRYGPSGEAAAAEATAATPGYTWPSEPEGMLTLLQQQRQQYRSWVAQCASTALAALDPSYDSGAPYSRSGGGGAPASNFPAGAIPNDVPDMVASMDVAGTVRQYLLLLKAAAEAVREAGRASSNFEALSLPVPERYGDSNDLAAGEALEAEYVSAAYAVTTAVAAAGAQVEQLGEQRGAAAGLIQELLQSEPQSGSSGAAGMEAPLVHKLRRIGGALCSRLRQEAEGLMTRISWPPTLADSATADSAAGAPGKDAGGAFAGFESEPVLARRLVGVLTALTHYQMAVEQRSAFYQILAGQAPEGGEGGERAPEGKPLLWAAKALAEPVAARLRAHFNPGAPTGRLDRPAWLYGTVLEFVRRHGHALASLDDMLACLQLKPHYNMPAEFARAIQEEVLELLRDQRIPAILQLQDRREDSGSETNGGSGGEADGAAPAEAEALWLGLMDASAAYDIAMLPLLGATGPRVEADASTAMTLLAAAAVAGSGTGPPRRRACDLLDPTAGGTTDMHGRYVAVAAAAGAAAGAQLLQAWAAAEGAAARRAVEAVVYDESSLAPAEEAAARALGAFADFEELAVGGRRGGGGGGGDGGSAPWQRDTWPPLLAREAAGVLDGLVARSRWLTADPSAQRDFLEASAGPVLALLRRRLCRLVDQAVARGGATSEEGLAKVCAALCAAHFLDDHLHSLMLTDLAPLVHALNDDAAAAAAAASAADGGDDSSPATPSSSFTAGGGGGGLPAGKLGGGGFWGGLLAAAGGGGGVPASPARLALRDGVTALAGGAAAGTAASLASASGGGGGVTSSPVLGEYVRAFSRLHRDGCLKVAREVALGFGRCSVAYRHAIEANPQFPFTPESDAEEDEGGSEGGSGLAPPASSITPSFGPALLFLQTTLQRLSRCCDKATFADVWRGAALSINRFMFNFIATESRFTRPGARQFAADVAGLAHLFTPYSRRGAGAGMASRAGSFSSAGLAAAAAVSGGQHFRELQAAARLLCLDDEEAAAVMRRASAAAVAAQAAANSGTPSKARLKVPGPPAASSPAASFSRGDPVRSGMAADPVLSAAGLSYLSPLQIMNVIEHRL